MSQKVPDYLAKVTGPVRDNSNFGPEDMTWHGGLRDPMNERAEKEKDVDSYKLLDEHGYEPDTPLEMLLRAIVEANPGELKLSDDQRVEMALKVLLGKKRRSGNKLKVDDGELLEIGKAWFHDFIEAGYKNPPLDPLIKRRYKDWPDEKVKTLANSREALVTRLRNKFKADKDLILARATCHDDWNSRDRLRAVSRVADSVRGLGIVIGKVRRRADATTSN